MIASNFAPALWKPLRIAALLLPCLTLVTAGAGPAVARDANRPYWLLVTFAAKGTGEEMAVVRDTDYDGMALPLGTAYDKGPGPTTEAVVARFTPLRDAAHKEIWPWVFVNRVPGLDLAPSSPARQPLLGDWRVALAAARRLGSPGVVLDLEFYSSPQVAWAMSKYAAMVNAPAPEAARGLENLGHELADIVAEEYPNAQILVFTTGLAFPNDERIGDRVYLQPRGHIVLGLLEELKRRGTSGFVIDGGEDGLAYCHVNLADLRSAIEKRREKEQPLLTRFNGYLVLGGTIAPWSEASARKGWLNQDACGAGQAQRAEDFVPYLQLLDATYRFNWVYAAPIGGYQPFDPQVAARFNAVVRAGRGQRPR